MSATTQALKNDDPWQIAKSRFLEGLDPSERQLFEDATLENLYYSTSNFERADAEDSKTRNAARRLGPLVSAIENYGSALDTYAQIAPLYLAPIWGSIRVLLVLAKKHGKFYEKVSDTLNRIGDILPRFRDYERIYDPQKHQRLTQALSNAYLDIIVLCTEWRKSLSEQKTSSIKRVFKPLSSNKTFDDAVERFRHHRETVREEAKICHQIEDAEHRNAQLILLAAETRRTLLSTLSKVDCGPRHRKLKAARHEGTGIWLTVRPEFDRWDVASTSSILCCHGIPGSGKSVMSSSIIDFLSVTKTTAFYYCDYADKRTLEPPNVFGTLARELLEQIDEIPEELATAIASADHDGEKMTDQAAALDILEKSIAIITQPVYLVLDGLDEISEMSQKVICKGLAKIQRNEATPVKLLITGRDDLKSLLLPDSKISVERIALSCTAIALDVESYVKAVTRRRIVDGSLVLLDPKLEAIIVKELVEGSKGMFLWVEFQMQDLCEQESDHGIRTVLKNLPQSLSETYDRLLNKIEGAGRLEMIENMFKWIACARQPLHVDEIREAVAFSLYDMEWVEEKIVTDFGRLVRACGNLVIVDNETQVVQLAHYTVQQYLLDPGENRFHFSLADANTLVGEVSIAYMNFSNFETQMTNYKENLHTDLYGLGNLANKGVLVTGEVLGYKMLQALKRLRSPSSSIGQVNMLKFAPPTKRRSQDFSKYQLLQYIVSHWLWHTANFEVETLHQSYDDRINRRGHLFKSLIAWKNLPFDFRPWGPLDGPEADFALHILLGWAFTADHAFLIHIACAGDSPLFALDPVLTRLGSVYLQFPESWTSYNSVHSRGSTDPIIDYNTHNGLKGTFISRSLLAKLAIFGEDSHHIQEPADQWLLSRLFNACRRGYLSVISAACDLGKCPEFLGVQLGIVAAESGQLEILQSLGACDGNLKEHFYNTKMFTLYQDLWPLSTLEIAIYNGHCDVVIELISTGFPTDNVFFFMTYADALFLAVRSNKPGAVASHLFLRRTDEKAYKDSDLEQMTNKESSAFIFASELGYHQIVSTFLEYGQDPDAKNTSGETALIQAIRGSHSLVVDILIRYKCSLDITPYGFPLSIAACHGNLDVINVLIAYGAEIFGKTLSLKIFAKMISFGTSPHTKVPQEPPCMLFCPTPLYIACYYGDPAIVQLLIEKGACVNLPSPTQIIEITADNNTTWIKVYEAALQMARPSLGPLFQELDPAGPLVIAWALPIVVAIAKGHKLVVELLLQAGAILPNFGCLEPNQVVALAALLTNVGLDYMYPPLQNGTNASVEETLSMIPLSTALQHNEVSAHVVSLCMHVGVDTSQAVIEGKPLILWALEYDADGLKELSSRNGSYEEKISSALEKSIISICTSVVENRKLHRLALSTTPVSMVLEGSLAQEGNIFLQKAFKGGIYRIVTAIWRDGEISQTSSYELLEILLSNSITYSEEHVFNLEDHRKLFVSAAQDPSLLLESINYFAFTSPPKTSRDIYFALYSAIVLRDEFKFDMLCQFLEQINFKIAYIIQGLYETLPIDGRTNLSSKLELMTKRSVHLQPYFCLKLSALGASSILRPS